MKRLIIGLALLLGSSLLHAAALTVTIWEPIPGKADQMMESAAAARAIHEKMGASVTLGLENTGRLHYAVGFDNWQAWAGWADKLQNSKDWMEWQASTRANPAALQEENFLLNVVPDTSNPVGEGGAPGSVYQVFIWKPPGTQVGPLVDSALEAKAIHEKSDIVIGINVDQLNRVHYVMNYRDWAHWAKVRDTPNPEFQAFMQRVAENPAGELVEVYTANRLP